MDLKIYQYQNCGTCKKALKLLDERSVHYETIAIRETPPSQADIKRALAACNDDIKRLFNVSGNDYRALNLKEKLPEMKTAEAVKLLASNGNLIKRPFVTGPGFTLVGFDPEIWEDTLEEAGM